MKERESKNGICGGGKATSFILVSERALLVIS